MSLSRRTGMVPVLLLAMLLTGLAVVTGLATPARLLPAASAADAGPDVPEFAVLDDENQDRQPFVGENFVAQSLGVYDIGDPQNTPWTCSVDFGDGTPAAGYWRAQHDPAPCAQFHTYAAPGSYTITMTVTDPTGATASATRLVDVTARTTTAVDGGVEGTSVSLAGPGTGPVTWRVLGEGTRECDLTDPSPDGVTLRCADQGTYQVRYDGPDAASSGEYDVTFVNGAPRPGDLTVRYLRNGDSYSRPVSRVHQGDYVRLRVAAHDPSYSGAYARSNGLGDDLTCLFDLGNGRVVRVREQAVDRCSADVTYHRAGTYRVRVTVTDDSGASATMSTRLRVLRRHVRTGHRGQAA